jgi:putative transposase
MMKSLHEDYPMPVMCRIYEVSMSGYYAWLSRSPSLRAQEDARLELEIRAAHQRTRQTFGPERLKDNLDKNGVNTSIYKVKRLRKKLGIRCKQVKKFKATTNSNHNMPVAPNLLEQKFSATAPNKVWLTDITYVQTDEGWLYLAGHKDMFTGDLVGYAMSERMTKNLVSQSLFRAVAEKRPPRGLIHHSDRGSQYCAHEYRKLLDQFGMVASMSRRGNCYDNAPMESFWGLLKNELVHHEKFKTRAEAIEAITEYIEIFYRRERTQARLGYLSPAAFERQYYENLLVA